MNPNHPAAGRRATAQTEPNASRARASPLPRRDTCHAGLLRSAAGVRSTGRLDAYGGLTRDSAVSPVREAGAKGVDSGSRGRSVRQTPVPRVRAIVHPDLAVSKQRPDDCAAALDRKCDRPAFGESKLGTGQASGAPNLEEHGYWPAIPDGETPTCVALSVAAGVGGKPTVVFSAVNVQIVSGSGVTDGAVNGEGNLVLGYDENPSGRAQTGSHDLILGKANSWTSYAQLVAGYNDTASGKYASVLGAANSASGTYATVSGGYANVAKATSASVSGGFHNTASAGYTSVSGGCSNLAGTGTPTANTTCTKTSGYPNSFATVSGGVGNQALTIGSLVGGGQQNLAADAFSSITGGCDNLTGFRQRPRQHLQRHWDRERDGRWT